MPARPDCDINRRDINRRDINQRDINRLDGLLIAFDRALRSAARVDAGCHAGASSSDCPARRRARGHRAFDIAPERLRALRGATRVDAGPTCESPAGDVADDRLDDGERRHSAGLMRVNHAGEVAAQALYRGQSLVARDPGTREAMEQAAREENDHLVWCRTRLEELGAAPRRLDPLWFAGSLAIGAAAGLAGDRWSLGFIVETERQVVEHLDDPLARLPDGDRRSRALLRRMQSDEQRHATRARAAGGAPLPLSVRRAMRAASKVMTRTAYWI